MSVAECQQTTTATEFETQWQTFLLDGMEGWLPQAWIASLQYSKVKPRQVLRWMISEFVHPDEQREMSDEDLQMQFKATAHRMGAKIEE
jgi:hypothetical protein